MTWRRCLKDWVIYNCISPITPRDENIGCIVGEKGRRLRREMKVV